MGIELERRTKKLAGFIHIGHALESKAKDRPRPALCGYWDISWTRF